MVGSTEATAMLQTKGLGFFLRPDAWHVLLSRFVIWIVAILLMTECQNATGVLT